VKDEEKIDEGMRGRRVEDEGMQGKGLRMKE